MKLKILFLALILGFVAIPAKASILCVYGGDEYYRTFYDVLESKRGNNIEFIKFCYEDGLENGYNLNKDYMEYGAYLTNIAADFNRFEALKFFLNKGHRLDDNRYTQTPLQFSAKNGNYAMTKYLLDKGASPVKKDNRRRYDAYDYAKQSCVQNVIDLVGAAWHKWNGTALLKTKEYQQEVKVDKNDYENFKNNLRIINLGLPRA